jgi:hypothetical protein
MNTRFWIAGWMMMLSLYVPEAKAEAEVANTAPSSPPSTSWFREKYLLRAHDIYYDYTLHRFDFGDNDRDVCPDVYNSATIYAITGRYFQEIKHTCSSLYIQKNTKNNNQPYIPPLSYDVRFIHITVTDVLQFLGQFICYTFEIGMIITSIVLAACSTLFMILLLFCQY